MIKKLLLTAFVGLCSLAASAQMQQANFTYAGTDSIGARGVSQPDHYDVANYIINYSIGGAEITAITGYMNLNADAAAYIKNPKVWLSKELNANGEADILTLDATLTPGTWGKEACYKVTAKLPQPYALDGLPIIVGYSFDIEVNPLTFLGDTRSALCWPVLTDSNPTGYPYALIMRTTNKYSGEWYMGLENNWNGAACIVTELQREAQTFAINLLGSSNARAALNQDWTADFQVANIGSNPISNLTYTVSIDEGTPVEKTYTLPKAVQLNEYAPSDITLPMPAIDEDGSHLVDVAITKVNGQAFKAPKTTAFFTVEVFPFAPKKRPLVEEYTGLWCGWCPRGYIAMEEIAKEYGDDQVSICYHNQDEMTVTEDYVFPNLATSPGLPTSSVDRIELIDPYYGSPYPYEELGIFTDVNNSLATVPYADLDLEVEVVDNNTINVTTNATFVKDVNNANYQLGYVLVCNNLTNSAWRQTNYYAQPAYYNPAQATGTPLEPLTKWGANIRGLVFNDVAVDVKGMKGVAGSIPTNIKAMEPITHKFSFDLRNNRVLNTYNIGEDGSKDLNNLVVTVFLIDKTTGQIENANKFAISGWNAVDNVTVDASVVATEYFDLSGRKVVNPEKGIFIKSEKLSDGSRRTTKVIRK